MVKEMEELKQMAAEVLDQLESKEEIVMGYYHYACDLEEEAVFHKNAYDDDDYDYDGNIRKAQALYDFQYMYDMVWNMAEKVRTIETTSYDDMEAIYDFIQAAKTLSGFIGGKTIKQLVEITTSEKWDHMIKTTNKIASL